MYFYPRRSGSYPLNMYYSPWRKGSYPLNMYFYPRLSGSYPLKMYYSPWRKGSYPLNMYFYPRLSGPYPLNMYYSPRRKGSYPLNMYFYPRLSGSGPLNMYYSPRRKGSYPLNMYFYPRRSGNFPRGSGNFLWRMGSYPVSEYFKLCSLPIVQRGSSADDGRPCSRTLALLQEMASLQDELRPTSFRSLEPQLRPMLRPAQKVDDGGDEVEVGAFGFHGLLQEGERRQRLAVDLQRREDRQHLPGQAFQIRRPPLLGVQRRQLQTHQSRVIRNAFRQKAIPRAQEERLGQLHLAQPPQNPSPHPPPPVLHPRLRKIPIQRPRLPIGPPCLRDAAGDRQVIDQVVLRAQKQAWLQLRIDQRHSPVEDGDRLLNLARKIEHGRELDQRPAGPVEVARGSEQLLSLPEESQGIGEPALVSAERTLQIQKDGLFTW